MAVGLRERATRGVGVVVRVFEEVIDVRRDTRPAVRASDAVNGDGARGTVGLVDCEVAEQLDVEARAISLGSLPMTFMVTFGDIPVPATSTGAFDC